MSEDNGNTKSIINVIDEFDYSTQNDSYNERFKKWRRKKENRYAFSFEANKKETVFVDGKGFIAHSAEEAEKEALSHIFYAVGIGILLWVLSENIFGKLGISVFTWLGFDIHNNFFSSALYGGSVEIVTALIAVSVLKIAIPGVVLHFMFRLPKRVEFMSRLNNSFALVGAIAAALIICVGTSLPSAYSSESKEIYDYFRSIDADVSVWDQSEFVIYTLFDVIVMSILTEMLFRGAMFAVLRQFGDPFAMIVTSLTAGLLTQDFRAMPSVMLISLIASYGMLSSGTIFTAVSVSIVYKMYSLALLLIETDRTEKMPLTRNIFMMIVLLAGIIGLGIYWFASVRKKKTVLARYRSEVSPMKRYVFIGKTFPYTAVLLFCLVCASIREFV